ncbi:hypothetical protein Back2_13860 [Nocardioides baekrokdamisoli]|uniref:DUF4157 domain-containing protein n=1 Tax=Nocardioides baekrokdamisoli TaxID=1804624 RepID=A0A3G9J280_9ACTN|nr:hypothetical protein [Nocardioides baekrokdamisoli]BBH17099.1 hypothetical protein Back2_13860 [Nocardioides baekrokdamisoli]
MSDQFEAPEVAKKSLGTGALIGLVLVIGILAGIGATWIRGTDSEHGPTYPSTWDPRVASLVAYVEEHRGLKFKHPVYVEFLSDKEFNAEVTVKDEAESGDARKRREQANGMVRALGVMSGGQDLLKLENKSQSGSVIGFYSYLDKKIRVRGDHLTPYTKVTLVHELTHVLQDQYFDLESTTKRLRDSKTVDDTAFTSIVEGDARRIENGYRKALSKADAAEVAKEEAKFAKNSDAGLKDVPEILQATDYAPYPLGNDVVDETFRKGGNDAVNKLFEKAPEHDIQIVEPWLLDENWKPTPVSEPKLATGEVEVDRGTFGVMWLYFLLTKGNSIGTALQTAGGDGGDLYVQYTKNGTSCMRTNFAGSSSAAAARIDAGLKRWAAAARTGATVTSRGSVVTLNTCDPGKTYKASGDHSFDALYVLTVRNVIVSAVESKGSVPTAFAVCYATAVVQAYTPEQLRAIDAGSLPLDHTKLQGLARSCE